MATSGKTSAARRKFAALVTVSAAVLASAQAWAQPTATADPPGSELEAVVVTGSRVARTGAEAPTPVTVLNTERLQAMAISNIGEGLLQLPQFVASVSPAFADQGSNPGQRLANLRGLGPNRTLVLFDGRRFTPTSSLGTVDLNLLPSMLTSRTEVVTGGASAAYGADAVAGALNIIPNTRYTGFKAETQFGIAEVGDAEKYRVAVAGGQAFAGGRGHVVASFEYEDNKAAGDCYTRDWCQAEWANLAVSPAGTGGFSARNTIRDGHNATAASGGLITTTALRGIQFTGGEGTANYVFGTPTSSTSMVGGSGHGDYFLFKGTQIEMPVERALGFVHARYDLTDRIEAFVMGNYGKLKSQARIRQVDLGSLTIQAANPFLPAAVRAQAAAAGVTNFRLGRLNEDINPQNLNDTEMFQVAVGLNGKLWEDWTWDATYQYGRNKLTFSTVRNRITANFNKALDARLNGAGQIVCAVNADAVTTNDDPACVALNLFGANRFSQAAFDYTHGTGVVTTTIVEHVAGVNLRGSPFSTWAGPVNIALGGEVRRDTIKGDADALSRAFAFASGNGQRYRGEISVEEAYLEASVPLADGLPLAHKLELNGAVRGTHYNVSGNIGTWKVGGFYEPVEGVRFRVTHSRDIRAPNAIELFSGRTQSPTQFLDTRGPGNPNGSGVFAPVVLTSSSNDSLGPERARTWTAGVVIQPRRIVPNLTLSLDYYDIELSDAIGRLGGTNIIARCAAGATEFCALLTRDPVTNFLTGVNDQFLNFGSNKVRGYDIEVNYRLPLERFGPDTALNFTVFASRALDLITTDSVGSVDRAGMLGLETGLLAGPAFVMDGTIGLRHGGFAANLQTRYIQGGKQTVLFIGPDDPAYNVNLPNSININRVEGRVYHNLSASYRFEKWGGRYQVYGAINNLMDKDPPVSPSAFAPTSPAYFDTLGRAYRIGLRAEF